MTTTPHVLNIFPANGASGIAISPQIKVFFDQEMDESSINSGSFIVAGPDNGIFFGDEFNLNDQPGLEDEDILSSPYYSGYVQGVVSFLRVDTNGNPVDLSAKDYTGDGELWRTVALFTPLRPLSPNNPYTVIISGDEVVDDYNSGVKTRTIFDPYSVAVTGTGSLYTLGGFSGTTQQTYHIEIISAGTTGNAEYEWYKEIDPLTVYTGITTTGERELEDGVIVLFDPDGEFEVGDHWSIVCKPGIVLPNNYRWSFTTGSGSIVVPASTYSASGIEELVSAGSGKLEVTKITPKDGATNLDTDSISEIEIEFNKVLDATTITSSTVLVWSESVNGDPNIYSLGTLENTITVSSNVINIELSESVQLYDNNIIYVQLSESIEAIDDSSFGEDKTFYFTTSYVPLYVGIRRIRLDLGPLIANIADDTINFAIFQASINADSHLFIPTITNVTYLNFAKTEYVVCLAELTLVRALMGDGDISQKMYKSLGDLSVSRGGMSDVLNKRSNSLEDCIARWQIVIQSGGDMTPDTSLKPGHSVKGMYAEDAITVNRQWESTSGIGYMPGANTDEPTMVSPRRVRTFRKRT
jgi:hypothetical protein